MVSDTGLEPAPSAPQMQWTTNYPNPRKIHYVVVIGGIDPPSLAYETTTHPSTSYHHIETHWLGIEPNINLCATESNRLQAAQFPGSQAYNVLQYGTQ